MRVMPSLETERLLIRPFMPSDSEVILQLTRAIGWVDETLGEAEQRLSNERHVSWLSLNHERLAALAQPPYGDRAVVLRDTGKLIGQCGIVPYLAELGVFPTFGGQHPSPDIPEVGLMWAIHPDYQRQGLATETAYALIGYVFSDLNLHHIIATTEYDNIASQSLMKKVGMRLERNPFADPPWLQVLGVVENPRWA